MLQTLFSTWIGGIYMGGLIASTLAKNPWGWKGIEGITAKVIACLFWPAWLAVSIIKQFKPTL